MPEALPEVQPKVLPAREPRHLASPRLLLAAFAAYSLAHLFNNTVLELEGPRRALLRLQILSGGWIEPVLVRSQVVLLTFLLVVVGFGRHRLSELGWRLRQLPGGILVYLGAWCVLQLGLLAAVMRQGVELEWHPMWTRFGLPAVLGGVIAQACGHALVEDTAFRGYLLPQLRQRMVHAASLLVMLFFLSLAILGSALSFGLAHLPTRLLVYDSDLKTLLVEQGHFLSAGLALGLAFVATRNLFVVIGLHVLLNDPAPLVAVPGEVLNRAILVVFGGVVLLASVRRIRRWRRRLREEREARRALAAELSRVA